jgi:uncharacterized protein YutE (UPF0331/DUF86 family)
LEKEPVPPTSDKMPRPYSIESLSRQIMSIMSDLIDEDKNTVHVQTVEDALCEKFADFVATNGNRFKQDYYKVLSIMKEKRQISGDPEHRNNIWFA